MTLKEATRDFQRAFIIEALERHGGNMCTAAIELGIHRNSMHRYVDSLEIDPDDFRRERRKKNASLNAYQRQVARALDPQWMKEFNQGSVYFRSPGSITPAIEAQPKPRPQPAIKPKEAETSKIDRMLMLASCRKHA